MVPIQDTILEREPSDVEVDDIPNCTVDEEEVKTAIFFVFFVSGTFGLFSSNLKQKYTTQLLKQCNLSHSKILCTV